MKLGELSLSVIEVFAVLVPGAIATALVAGRLQYQVPGVVFPPMAWGEAAMGAIALVVAWTAGQLLFRLGSGLDSLYDVHRRLTRRDDRVYTVADAIRKRRAPDLPGSLSTFKWAKAWFGAEAPGRADAARPPPASHRDPARSAPRAGLRMRARRRREPLPQALLRNVGRPQRK